MWNNKNTICIYESLWWAFINQGFSFRFLNEILLCLHCRTCPLESSFLANVYLVVIEGSEDIVQHLLMEDRSYAPWYGRYDPHPVSWAASSCTVLILHVLHEGLSSWVVIHDGHILFLELQRDRHTLKIPFCSSSWCTSFCFGYYLKDYIHCWEIITISNYYTDTDRGGPLIKDS